MSKIKISVYINTGVVFDYEVGSPASAREHAHAIVMTGYRHTTPTEMTHFPPHAILKVKCVVVQDSIVDGEPDQLFSTGYADKVHGT